MIWDWWVKLARIAKPREERDMPELGPISRDKLKDADPRLQEIIERAATIVNLAVTETHRGKERQDRLYEEGKSQLRYPRSKHNAYPSLAVDVVPWPVDWDDIRRFDRLSGVLFGVADMLGYKLRWGGDWDRDWDLKDNRFNDLPHFEIYE